MIVCAVDRSSDGSETAYGIHPVDMTEVYGLEEEDGTWKPLCKGLFQSNPDTEIRQSLPVLA